MRIVETFPFGVREVEHAPIPLPDGARLSARLWLPEGAGRVPAVVEYIPYRKRDDTRWRDEPMHGYFAGHGYASVRIDVRGSGASDGILVDEYADAEWADGLEALRWVAAQPWCDGRVGLMGKSWGGINALQLAALDPPEVHAVIAVCASDDRWTTDAHRMGGCLLSENLTWGSVLQLLAMRPQDPELVGAAWRDTWRARLRETPWFVLEWLRHSTRDAYWRRGSVGEDPSRIRVPVLAVSGWADAYADAVPRLLDGLSSPARGWVGPWAHVYPHNGIPGPPAGFLQVALRWWDTWLRGGPPEASAPLYRAWMSEGGGRPWAEPMARGRWVAEASWPSPRVETVRRPLGKVTEPDRAVPWTSAGALAAGAWCPFGMGDLAGDQEPDDASSLLFDLPPLGERLEVLGAPAVELELSCDRPDAMIAVRLCDVAPDGTSVRVSYGLLDLAFREGFDARLPLRPGARYRVRVPMRHCGHAFLEGHTLRVAVSSSYWPVAWPLARPYRFVVTPAGCSLTLPVRPPRDEDVPLAPPPSPEAARSASLDVPDPPPGRRQLRADRASGELTLEVEQGWDQEGEPYRYPVEPIGLESGWGISERLGVQPDDPRSARASIRHVAVSGRGDWSARLELDMSQERTEAGFRVRACARALEGGTVTLERSMDEEVFE